MTYLVMSILWEKRLQIYSRCSVAAKWSVGRVALVPQPKILYTHSFDKGKIHFQKKLPHDV